MGGGLSWLMVLRHGKLVLWQFVQDNWDALKSRFAGAFLLQRIVKISVSMFASEEMASAAEDFFEGKEGVKRSVRWTEPPGEYVISFCADLCNRRSRRLELRQRGQLGMALLLLSG